MSLSAGEDRRFGCRHHMAVALVLVLALVVITATAVLAGVVVGCPNRSVPVAGCGSGSGNVSLESKLSGA